MKSLLMAAMIMTIAQISTPAAAAPVEEVNAATGHVLAGENGMTLYTFKKDGKNTSNCYDGCAKNWPPLYAKKGDKAMPPYSIIERKDGTLQWAKDGLPLYYWIKDKNPGDTTGDGVKGVWDVARP